MHCDLFLFNADAEQNKKEINTNIMRNMYGDDIRGSILCQTCISYNQDKKWILLFGIFRMLFIAMPQAGINYKHFNTWSPMIQTQLDLGESLHLSQLEWGISMQKYETNIDDTVEDIPAGMIFEDTIGTVGDSNGS